MAVSSYLKGPLLAVFQIPARSSRYDPLRNMQFTEEKSIFLYAGCTFPCYKHCLILICLISPPQFHLQCHAKGKILVDHKKCTMRSAFCNVWNPNVQLLFSVISPETLKMEESCLVLGSPKGNASQGMVPKYSLKESSLRSPEEKIISKFFPAAFILL